MTLHKTYQFRLKPNAAQRQALERNAGCRRWVWNWALGRKQQYYRENGVGLPTRILQAELPILKRQPETAWLAEADAQSLQETLRDLDRAYVNFFEKRAHFPRFKSRKRDRARLRVSQRVKVADGRVYIPKVGSVGIRQSQPVDGETKSATFKRDATGNWDVTLVSEFTMPDTSLAAANPALVVGLDLGLEDFAVLSDGSTPTPIPQFFRKAERKLRKAQRIFSRREKGSRRRLRAKHKVALVHRKTANQRKDFLHKLTTGLVVKYEGICIEDLNVAALAKTKLRGHAKSWHDAAAGEFRRQLKYKTIWNRRHLAVIDGWYPSSKTCHACGAVNTALTLEDRSWTCVCGVFHDRDFNASLNIRTEGLKLLAVGHGRPAASRSKGRTDRLNAQGAGIRPPQLEAVGVEL